MNSQVVPSGLSPKELSLTAANAALDKKGEDVIILDLVGISTITDFFIIATANNARQIRTVAEEVEKKVKEAGGSVPRSIEGLSDASWVLMDYVDFVVHIFLPETRRYYSLDRLWADAQRLEVAVGV